MIAAWIEDIKIVLHRRKRYEAAHAQARNIYEETHVAHVRHERGVTLRLAGLELSVEKCEQLHIFAVTLGIRGVAFSRRNVLGSELERGSGALNALKERAMHHEVG